MVILSGKDLDDAERLMKLLARPEPDDPTPGIGRSGLIEASRAELERRRRRADFLPDGMFGEPAWEILLLLYNEQQGARFTIARLAASLEQPPTSTLRWLNYLQDRQFVIREEHPTDQRSVFLKLTPTAVEALDRYFSETITKRS